MSTIPTRTGGAIAPEASPGILRGFGGVLAFFALASASFAAAQLSISSQTVAPGASFTLPVQFASQGLAVSGVQFDVTYDNTALSLSAKLSDAATNSGKSVYFADVSINRKRFLVAGINKAALPDGLLINLVVSANPTVLSGSFTLTSAGSLATDPDGHAAAIAATGGTVTIQRAITPDVQVVNSGSFLTGPVAPGELVTLFGLNIGPAASVFFDALPAWLLYQDANQINAIVPYGVYGRTSTQVQIGRNGQAIAQTALSVALAAPALFTTNSSGTGPGAILNQDLTMNTALNPAARGSIVVLYATGAGQTDPPGVDGQVAADPLPKPTLGVSVKIGGLDAEILYAGAAPGLVAGVLQVNCRVPVSVAPGSSVPVVLTAGTFPSRTGVTLAVQ